MAVMFVVMFRFKPLVSKSKIEETLKAIRECTDEILDPDTKELLSISGVGGFLDLPDNTLENEVKYSHVFIDEFENEDDVREYMHSDKYQKFWKRFRSVLEKPVMGMFTPVAL